MARAVTVPRISMANFTARAVGTSIPLALAAPWPRAAGGVNKCPAQKILPRYYSSSTVCSRVLLVCQHRPVLCLHGYNLLVI